MTTNPAVLSALLQLTAVPAGVISSSQNQPLQVEVDGATITLLDVISGQYTPANDMLIMVRNLALKSPNFIALIVDQLVNFSTDNGMLVKVPVGKLFVASLGPLNPGANPIDQLILDGSAANPYPMIQGQLVNYTLIIGQAVLS